MVGQETGQRQQSIKHPYINRRLRKILNQTMNKALSRLSSSKIYDKFSYTTKIKNSVGQNVFNGEIGRNAQH